jgi:hypothetical protein
LLTTLLWNRKRAIRLNYSGWLGLFLNPEGAVGLPYFLQVSKTSSDTFVCSLISTLILSLSLSCVYVVVSRFGILQGHKYYTERLLFSVCWPVLRQCVHLRIVIDRQSTAGVGNLRHASQAWHAERFSMARWVNWNTVIMIS